jgi:uncharacterized membrane protein
LSLRLARSAAALRIFLFIHISLTALLAGLHFGSVAYYNPGLDSLPADVFIQAQQSIEDVFSGSMPIFMAATVVSAAPVIWFLRQTRAGKPVFLLFSLAFAFLIAQLVITLVGNVPINDQISSWSPDNPPAEWQEVRDRWNLFNNLRTMFLVAALGVQLGGLLAMISVKASPKPGFKF